MSRREWIVLLLLVLSVVINYVDRSNLSLAMPLLERQFSFSSLRAGELLVEHSSGPMRWCSCLGWRVG